MNVDTFLTLSSTKLIISSNKIQKKLTIFPTIWWPKMYIKCHEHRIIFKLPFLPVSWTELLQAFLTNIYTDACIF